MSAAIAIRRSRLARPRVSRAARIQIGIFLLAYLVYSAARYFTVGDLDQAKANATWILDLEHHVGVADEGSIQDALTGTFWLWLLNHAYLAAQLVVLPGSLIFLYHRSRPVYERLRNTILATWLISLPVYALFPVAPPRLAGIGMVDTVSSQTGFAMDSSLTTKFYNELAAVPSLHVGFAVAIGIAIAAAVRHPLAKAAVAAVGPDHRPRRHGHGQPLRVRHRRGRRRRGPGLRARRGDLAGPSRPARPAQAPPGPSPAPGRPAAPGLRRGARDRAPRARCRARAA